MKLPHLPSLVWIILMALGLIAFIGSIITGFFLIATVEGVASIIFLIIGWFAFIPLASEKVPSIFVAGAVGFYALMGMAVDQPGNIIFNYPFKYLCSANSTMNRDTVTLHPLPGRTDIIQDFRCFDAKGNTVKRISPFEMIAVRFVEYLVIAYVFIGIHKILRKKKI